MSGKRAKPKAGRPLKVPGEKGTKERIFDAAVDLFAERGYDGVSIRDIGRAVGITEGAVYKHYKSKDEIIESIFAYVQGHIYSGEGAPAASLDALVAAVPFREFLESIPGAMISDPLLTRTTRIMLIEMYHNEKIRDHVRRELFERPVDEMAIVFEKYMEKGKIRPCNPRALGMLFISCLVYWYFETFIFSYGARPGTDRVEKELRAQVDLIVDLTGLEGGRAP